MAKNTTETGNFRKGSKTKEEEKPKSPPFWKDRRFQISLGLVFIFSSVFLFLSFSSYLFTAADDQSLMTWSTWARFKEARHEVSNSLSLSGAWLSYMFIYRWFGLGAFFLCPILFALGSKLLFVKRVFSYSRLFYFSLFFMIWISLFLGYIDASGLSGSALNMFIGGLGYEMGNLAVAFTGFGTYLILGLSLVIFVIYFFNVTHLPSFLKPRTKVPTTDWDEESGAPIKPWKEEKVIERVPTTNEEDSLEDEDETKEWKVVIKGGAKETTKAKELELEVELPDELDEEVELVVEKKESKEELGKKVENYDPTLDLSSYKYPTLELLEEHGGERVRVTREELEENKVKIVDTLSSFQIGIETIKATIGPTVTLYEIIPKSGVKISKIRNLEDDIALNLAALGIRIIAPIPGKGTIGIEVPNKNREMVSMKSILGTEKFLKSEMELPIVLGKTISNEIFMTDLAKMPHLLMAGATGQGKSVGINVILASLLYKKHPSQLKFVLVDPKKVELTLFNKIERHFLAMLPDGEEAIITDTRKVVNTLNSLCIEMENRYNLLKDAGCRNLKEYNTKFIQRKLNPKQGHRFLPYIVLVIDELADLMMTAGKEVETPIARLAQLARAIGIHLVVATQRPSVNVITGIIKANFPARLSFRVTSKVDSRVILDTGGADQLIGQGDMLLSMGSEVIRLQCAYIDTREVDRVCDFIGEQKGYQSAYLLPEYVGEESGEGKVSVDLADRDELFDEAARLIVAHQQGSTSLIQRKMKLGYNRAGRLIDQLEAAGIVGAFEGSKAREVLIQDEYALEQLLREMPKK
jgi:S-DNA-T family DNA segregation ATPase FtsK/SpoIIIE